MQIELLTTYLKDHLAGSVAAIELVDHLIKITKGGERERFFVELGIQGKRLLWRGLELVAHRVPQLRPLDLPRLQQRADDQAQRVETQRLQVAATAFAPDDARTTAPSR